MAAIFLTTQIAKFMGPTWGPPGSCRPQMGPMNIPVVINNLKADILNKIDTHSLYGFVFYIKRIWLNEYKTECVEPNCYVCNRRS